MLREGELGVVVVGYGSLDFIGIAEKVSIFIHRYVKYIMVDCFKNRKKD